MVALVATTAAAVFAIVVHTLVSDTDLSDQQAIGSALAQGIAVLIALRTPWTAWTLSTAASALTSIWSGSGLWVDAMFNSYLIVLGIIALRSTTRDATAIWAATAATGVALAVLIRPADWLSALPATALLTGLVLVAGTALRGLAAAQTNLRRQRAATQRERDRNAMLNERAQIARELHDVVAHHMSVIAIESEAARYRDPALAPQTAASLETIRTGAVTALEEMRHILGVLRSGDTGRLPQPTLADITDLVDSVRATGALVDLDISGSPTALPAGLGLSAYRIVQEALSNAVRHAPGSSVRIRIDITLEEIAIRIDNDASAEARPAPGSGHGLLGMRERVAGLGGTLDTGPTADGGYRVAVALPIRSHHR